MPTTQSFEIPKGVEKTLKIKPIVQATGKGGEMQPTPLPTWTGFDPAKLTVDVQPDGYTAKVTANEASINETIQNHAQNSVNNTVFGSVNLTSPNDPADAFLYELT